MPRWYCQVKTAEHAGHDEDEAEIARRLGPKPASIVYSHSLEELRDGETEADQGNRGADAGHQRALKAHLRTHPGEMIADARLHVEAGVSVFHCVASADLRLWRSEVCARQ